MTDGQFVMRQELDPQSLYSQSVTTTLELMEWLAAEAAKRPGPIEPFRLTQQQLDQVKASMPVAQGLPGAFGSLLGIPVEIVEDARDSTPYKRWLEDAKAALVRLHERIEW